MINKEYKLFGPASYSQNRKEMERVYHPSPNMKMKFWPANSSESIEAAAYDIADTKEKILDPRWLQLCYIVKTSEGVFVNTEIDSENILKQILNHTEKVNGIYLLPKGKGYGFGFAPYKTFKQGEQSSEEFAHGGLARALENSRGDKAENLLRISSPNLYKNGVYVCGFDKVKEPALRVAGLDSDGGSDDGDRLCVCGDYWDDNLSGYAFGTPGFEKIEK